MTNDPPISHPGRCKDLTRRVDANGAVSHPLNVNHLWQRLVIHIVKGHIYVSLQFTLVDVVFHHDDLGVLL